MVVCGAQRIDSDSCSGYLGQHYEGNVCILYLSFLSELRKCRRKKRLKETFCQREQHEQSTEAKEVGCVLKTRMCSEIPVPYHETKLEEISEKLGALIIFQVM